MATAAWSAEQLPPQTVEAVRAAARPLADRIIDAVCAENPTYAEVLGGPEGMGIRLGVEEAIRSFLDALERGEPPRGETAEVWRRLGEAEFQSGRSLDALRAAFRTGTRAAWKGAADLAAQVGISTPLVIALAEGIFVYSDALAVDVVEGYLRMQSDEAGERERRRRRLLALLLDPHGADREALEHTAELARWPLPKTVAVMALPGESSQEVARRLGLEVLVGSDGEGTFMIVPDPHGPGRRARLGSAMRDEPVALGPEVAPHQAARSLEWARRTLALMERGAIPERGLAPSDEHLGTLILLGDEPLARRLVELRLAAVEQLPALERDRLLDTLRSWLAHQRHTPRVAAELHVHPQTVRYRIGKLQELLGPSLETPEGRFELELALRARSALSSGPEATPPAPPPAGSIRRSRRRRG